MKILVWGGGGGGGGGGTRPMGNVNVANEQQIRTG